MKLLLATLLLVGSSLAQAATCPLGADHDHLTIHQVMINFGKYTMDADQFALFGATDPTNPVTDDDLKLAIQNLEIAIACTEAVISNPTGDLLPDKATFLKGQERADYITDFVDFMTDYHDALKEYQKMFVQVFAQAPQARDYKPIYKKSKDLTDLIAHAHGKLTPAVGLSSASDGPTLKQNMRSVGRLMKQIASSIQDKSKNASNADAAGQVATLLATTKSQIPDAINALPDSEKSAAITDYQQRIQQEVDLANQLQQSFLSDDNVGAANIVQQMMDQKKSGHDIYNP